MLNGDGPRHVTFLDELRSNDLHLVAVIVDWDTTSVHEWVVYVTTNFDFRVVSC